MKRLLSLLLLPALALPGAPGRAAPDRAVLVSLAASVLRIEAPLVGGNSRGDSRGGLSLGSAVAVGADRVVTNCHVTRDAQEIHVVRGGVRWPAVAQASDVGRDLCLLLVPGLQAPAVPLARAADLAIGQAVTALGYTGGLGLQGSGGEVIELHRHDGGRVIQSSNRFSSGASGGGLFDTAGRLVGILTFRLRGGEAHYFSAPAEWVQQMLDDTERGSFRKVMPLDTRQRPYWQLGRTAEPRFLRAAQLLRDARWRELESMTDEWARAEPGDAEPWYLLGTALGRLSRLPQARRALECSLQLAPAHAPARALLAQWAAPDHAEATGAATPPCPTDLR